MVTQDIQIFAAPTMHEALAKVRETLGADAVILHTRQLNPSGLFGRKGSLVEVTAAPGVVNEIETSRDVHPVPKNRIIDTRRVVEPAEEIETPTQPAEETVSADRTHALEEQVERLQSIVDRLSSVPHAVHRSPDAPPAPESKLHQYLREIEISDSLIQECVNVIEHQCPGRTDPFESLVADTLVEFIASRIHVKPLLDPASAHHVIAMVGPTGSGKTTTIAKIAADTIEQGKRPVALASIDGYRIGASEEIRRYGEIFGCPHILARSASELRRFIDRQPIDSLVLIDTPGWSITEVEEINQLRVYLERGIRVAIVLAANNRASSTRAALDAFRPLDYERLILTKLDETPGTGGVASTAVCSPIPLSYVCMGQNVRRDLEDADPLRLARWSLGEAARRPVEPVVIHS